MKQILTTGEVAKHCNVHFRTVIRWIERGYLQAYKLPGRGDNRIRVEDFLTFLKRHQMPIPDSLIDNEPKILIIDDDIPMVSAMRRILVMEKMQVKVAFDGFQAGALVSRFKPQVLSLDLQMLGMNGFQVLQFIRQDDILKNLQILVVSGLEQSMLDKALVEGANDILKKPFKNETYIKKINGLLKK